MPVIRCQACGKPNPDFLDVCQYCEARLKPLLAGAADETLISRPAAPASADETLVGRPAGADDTISLIDRLRAAGPLTPEGEAEAEAPAAEDASPDDWLSRLRGMQTGAEPAPPAEREVAAEPDWMWGGAAAAEPPAAEAAPEPPAAAPPGPPPIELPDWLKDSSAPPLPEVGEAGDRPRRKMTDWLNALQGPGADLPAPDVDQVPDWLKDLGQPDEAAAPAAEAAAQPTPAADLPDWLRALRSQGGGQGAGEAPAPAEREAEALPAWMRGQEPLGTNELPALDEPPPGAAPTDEPPPPAASADTLTHLAARSPSPTQRAQALPAWMRTDLDEAPEVPPPPAPEPRRPASRPLRPRTGSLVPKTKTGPLAEQPAAQTPPPADATLPGQAAALPAAGDDMPAWLKDMVAPGETPPAPLPPSDVPQPKKKKKMTDWLGEAPPTPEEAGPLSDELPDWLRSLSAGQPEASAAQTPTPEEDLPEWLRTVAGPGTLPPEPPPPPAPVALPGELPDWMAALAPTTETAAASSDFPELDAPQALPGELPDWMAGLAPTTETAAAPPDFPEVDAPQALPGDLPDWLAALSPAAPQPEAAAQPAGVPELDEETLDWLTQLSASPEGAAALAAPPAPDEPAPALAVEPAAEAPPAELLGLDTAALPAESPEWLAELAAATVAEPPPAEALPVVEAEAGIEPTPEAELPDWLRALRGMPVADEVPADEMPEWLRALRGQPSQAEAAAEMPEGEPLAAPAGGAQAAAPGTLPAWLEAMRPIDIAQPLASEADAYQENLGVLSGMRGVLRAEPVVAQLPKPAPPVRAVEVSDAHSAHAKLLTEMLAFEPTPAPRRARAVRSAGALVERWVVFGVLALAILLAQFQLPGLFGPPSHISEDTRNAYVAVLDLAARSGAPGTPIRPLLVALDYEAAQQGELNPAVQAIVSQALAQGGTVLAVSARPEGAAVAQALLDETVRALEPQTQADYVYGTHYLNLGYIPGGPVGVLQFSVSPRAAFSTDFSGELADVWAAPAAAPVQRLSDFGLIVVAAGNPQAMRGWIEQARFNAPGVPMLAVASAGAEPLVRPYLMGQDPQLAGMVAGLAGAAQFEAQAGRPGAGAARWPALGGGLLTAAALIAAGAAVFGVLGLVRRRK